MRRAPLPAGREPAESRARLHEPLPRAGQGYESAYRDFVEHVLPYPTGNIHPRFWGWVIGTGTPFNALTEMLAATLNPNVSGFDDGASLVETATGNVWLSLQEGASQQLQVETSGKVTSAVPLKDEGGPATEPGGRRRMVAQDGHGGVPVVVRSESGAVEVSQRRK